MGLVAQWDVAPVWGPVAWSVLQRMVAPVGQLGLLGVEAVVDSRPRVPKSLEQPRDLQRTPAGPMASPEARVKVESMAARIRSLRSTRREISIADSTQDLADNDSRPRCSPVLPPCRGVVYSAVVEISVPENIPIGYKPQLGFDNEYRAHAYESQRRSQHESDVDSDRPASVVVPAKVRHTTSAFGCDNDRESPTT